MILDGFSAEGILVEILNCGDFGKLLEYILKGNKDTGSIAISGIYWEMGYFMYLSQTHP